MRKVRYLFFAAFVAACCGGAMSGCIKEDGATPGSDTKNVPVLLNIGTRSVDATDGTPTSEEAKLHTLRVYAFIGNERVGYYYSEVPSEKGSVRFLMDMTLKSTTTQTVDFYVVANEQAMTGGSHTLSATTTRDQLDGYTFTGLSLTNGLPMFCKKVGVEIDVAQDKDPNAPEDPNPPVNAGDHDDHTQLAAETIKLELRRPVAKLGVFAAKQPGETAELTITGLALQRQGMRTSNYLMPQSEETLKGMQASGSDTDFALVPVQAPVAELNGPGAGDDGYTPVLEAPFYPFENPWGSDAPNAPGAPTAMCSLSAIGSRAPTFGRTKSTCPRCCATTITASAAWSTTRGCSPWNTWSPTGRTTTMTTGNRRSNIPPTPTCLRRETSRLRIP